MKLSNDETRQIAEARSHEFSTRRATVPALEDILYTARPVLDHGFVRVVDYMGDDTSVVQAARVSYGRGTKQVTDDRNLIRYLLRHSHTTPFEMAEIKLHVKLPIFVARQWIRHRTASVNEYSARYSILDKEFYVPERSNLAAQSSTNRQGREGVLDADEADRVLTILRRDAETAYSDYLDMLNLDENDNVLSEDRSGLARELARMNLSLNFYTQWYWKIDLHNFINFLRLRADPHAQYEIRAYAEVLLEIFRAWCPISYEAFLEYKLHSTVLSRSAIAVLKKALRGERVTREDSGLSKREWDELNNQFQLG
ncbi:FAD-dependent thymidylate synthase [Bradyrhizobium cajani]|uniref:Flavin-dependent thymidylate synthase n=1 Tax=Bradyrhizobium cajani TaxID=1928661 RepID=A0A844SZM2_9BRAD|nr:FAD-dependent thymidylate synthase [Bradyrhizobium cajani]MCP3371614.1 FAD-dependent thymidylate synthase [Bradyrhizobium cajani]MVT72338.1 FAD-dependent thymidylate synthase [Bradyrhizobium cajani]